MSARKPHVHVCAHGNSDSCPHDFLCQARLKGNARHVGEWETHTVIACDHSPESWRAQVGPVLRARNYETRVVLVMDTNPKED